jgi:hypothetical protein
MTDAPFDPQLPQATSAAGHAAARPQTMITTDLDVKIALQQNNGPPGHGRQALER